MKKTVSLLVAWLAAAPFVFGQWQVAGGFVGISAKTFFVCESQLQVQIGTFQNKGTVTCLDWKTESPAIAKGAGTSNVNGNFVNLGKLQENGAYLVRGNLNNVGDLVNNAKFTLLGDAPATIATNGKTIYQLTLNKGAAAKNIQLLDNLRIGNKITFSGANNKLVLGDQNLTLAATATFASVTSTKFVATTGTGSLIKENLGSTAFTFPVGATTTTTGTWNGLILSNTGTADNIGVRALPEALTAGGSGTPISTDAVSSSWQITEATAGGSNLSVTARWATADELAGFTRATCAVRQWTGSVWDSSPLGAAAGAGSATNPWNRTRTGISSAGYFAVLDGAFPVPPTPAAAERSEGDFSLKIFPNPAVSEVFIQSDLPAVQSLRVVDAVGREVLFLKNPKSLPSGERLDMAGLAAGVYQIELQDLGGSGKLAGRFVKLKN